MVPFPYSKFTCSDNLLLTWCMLFATKGSIPLSFSKTKRYIQNLIKDFKMEIVVIPNRRKYDTSSPTIRIFI